MYDRILVPTDGSKGAETAVDHALSLAEKYDAEIHVYYVVDVRAENTTDLWSNLVGEFEEIGENSTGEIKERAEKRGIEAVTEVEHGIPHREINAYAEENDIDMIVMGTHGRTGLDRMLLGSVTEKVVRNSNVPVLTVGRE